MADAVRLEITVDDKGSPVIKAVTENLDKLARQSTKTSESQTVLNRAADAGVRVFGDFGVQLGGVVGRVAGAVGPIGLLAGTIGTGLVAATTHAVNAFQQFAFQVRDLSYLSGGSAEDVAGLITAMEDLGVESGAVEQGINKMSQAVATGDPTIRKLVGSFRTTSGAVKDGLTLFYETVDALGAMTNATERNRAAQEIFGRGWIQMLPAIQKGAAAIKEMGVENAALGKGMTEGGIQAAEQYRMAMNDLKDVIEGATVAWGNRLIPTVTRWIQLLTPGTQATRYYIDEMGLLRDRVEDTAEAYAKLDEEQRRFLAAQQNAARHAKPTPRTGPMQWETDEEKKRKEEQLKKDLYFLDLELKAQAQLEKERAEFNAWESKTQQDAIKTEEEKTAKIMKLEADALAQLEKDRVEFLQWDTEQQKDRVQAAAALQEQITEADIKYWVARIEAEEALYEKELQYLNAANAAAAKTREEAWKKSFQNVRGITEDAMGGVANAISTSIRGVIQGTQTLEQAFKRMGENIALGLVDSIVNRGMRAVQESLLDAAFGKSSSGGGGGGINWAGLGSSIVSGASSMAGGVVSVVETIGSYLGAFDTGLWTVPAGKAGGTVGTWGGAASAAGPASGWAVLHPGEMIVPPDVAEQLRRMVALTGGSDFRDLSALLPGGAGGRGGVGSLGGQYGSLSPSQRGALGSVMGGITGYGALANIAGQLGFGALSTPTFGLGALRGMLGGILGIDALMSTYGLASFGYAGISDLDIQGIRDTFGFGSIQEAEARTASAIGRSLEPGFDPSTMSRDIAAAARDLGFAAGEVAGSAPEGTPTAGAPSFGEGGYGESNPGADLGGIGHDAGNTGEVGYARGGLFTTRGRTRMVVGEAGRETVAVLRNPREAGVGGGSTISVHFDLRGSVLGNELPTNTVRTLKRQLERLESRTLRY